MSAAFPLGEKGQGTVEYVIVLFGFLALIVTLGLLWHLVRDGALTELAVAASSHSLSGGLAPALKDLLSY